jgi:Domain of unknown function (DUF4145)
MKNVSTSEAEPNLGEYLPMSTLPEESRPARAFVCPHCDRPALASVQGIAIWDGWDKESGESVNPPIEYALTQCSQCNQVSVQAREDFGDGFDDDTPSIIYPAPRQLNWNVPIPLRREFEEAQICFAAKAYEATAVMVRRVLEGTCEDNGVQERVLARSLQKLKENGLIDSTIADWADALRLVGNEGAHYTGKQVSRMDAEDALAFAEALLDHIYVLRQRFEEFASRRRPAPPETGH